jgi:hypothetical protein
VEPHVTERLARAGSRHPGRVIAIWVVAVFASFPAIGIFLGDVLTADVEVTADTESRRAERLLDDASPQSRAERQREVTEAVVVRAESGEISARDERVRQLAGDLRAAGASAVDVAPGGEALVGRPSCSRSSSASRWSTRYSAASASAMRRRVTATRRSSGASPRPHA